MLYSLAPALLALLLFVSLAVHMRLSLGQWPRSIGFAGFPPALYWHGEIATSFFWWLLLPAVSLTPLVVLICLAIARWRGVVPYIALFCTWGVLSISLMRLAPEPFLQWWKD